MEVPHTTCLEGTRKFELETQFWFLKRAFVLHLVLMKDGKQTLHVSTTGQYTCSQNYKLSVFKPLSNSDAKTD
jgi:hypothetical protein